MSLNYELGGIDNWEELRDTAKTRDMVFSTISAGMGDITEKNYIEFYLRVAAVDAMSPWPSNPDPITLQDVKRHIGLRTNVTTESRSKWIKRIMDNDIREIEYRLRRDAKTSEPVK